MDEPLESENIISNESMPTMTYVRRKNKRNQVVDEGDDDTSSPDDDQGHPGGGCDTTSYDQGHGPFILVVALSIESSHILATIDD